MTIRFVLLVSLVACSKDSSAPPSDKTAPPAGSNAAAPKTAEPTTPPAPTAAPTVQDQQAATLVRAGAKCPIKFDDIALDCPERKAIEEHAFQNQQSVPIATTCVALLRESDLAVRLTAAACLFKLTSVAQVPVLGALLDALEAEKDPKVRAEAAEAKLDGRVRSLIERYSATGSDDDDRTAGNLLGSLFPEYLMASAPKPAKESQALVLTALARPKGTLLIRALDKVRLVEDKPAACTALRNGIRADNPEWWRFVDSLADLKDACTADAPKAFELAIEKAAAGQGHVQAMLKLDRRFELAPALRSRAAKELRAGAKKAREWERKGILEAAKTFEAPRKPAT